MPRIPPRPYWQTTDRSIRLYQGDCLPILSGAQKESVDLVFADPPFNIGHKYDHYDDNLPDDEYRAWTWNWLCAVERVMRPGASIYVAICPRYQAMVRQEMDGVGLQWRSTICWYYTFGPRQDTNWTPSWVAIHYATKGGGWTWNPEPIRVPSARQLKYNDRRAQVGGKVPDNVWILLPREQLPDSQENSGGDFWLSSRVCGTFKERTAHPCQMPEAVITRIVAASSNPGDLVLDPFLGSGMTAAVCQQLGRQGIGIELSADYLDRCAIPRLTSLSLKAGTRPSS